MRKQIKKRKKATLKRKVTSIFEEYSDNIHRPESADDRGDGEPEYPGQPNINYLRPGQCPFCFMDPCIATANTNDPWLGNGQPPSNDNPQVRKNIYRRFWKCINNMYGWHIPQYIEEKQRVGGGEWVVMHQREVMPECVLELVQNMYPNPHGVPYLGHTWEYNC